MLCEYTGMHYGILLRKILFMKKYNVKIFDYIELGSNFYIIVDNELKKYLERYTPFIMYSNCEYSNIDIKASKTFANYIIGFY